MEPATAAWLMNSANVIEASPAGQRDDSMALAAAIRRRAAQICLGEVSVEILTSRLERDRRRKWPKDPAWLTACADAMAVG